MLRYNYINILISALCSLQIGLCWLVFQSLFDLSSQVNRGGAAE